MRQTLDALGQKQQRLAPKQLQFAAVYRTAAPSPPRSVFLSPERSVSREHRQKKHIILRENSLQVAGAGRRSTIQAITSHGPCVLSLALSTYRERWWPVLPRTSCWISLLVCLSFTSRSKYRSLSVFSSLPVENWSFTVFCWLLLLLLLLTSCWKVFLPSLPPLFLKISFPASFTD